MKLKLTDDLVLIEPLSRPRITSAGIEIPEGAELAEPRYGEVVEVGLGKLIEAPIIIVYQGNYVTKQQKNLEAQLSPVPFPGVVVTDDSPLVFADGRRLPMSFKPGDRVFYNVMNLHPIIYNGKGHFLVREHAIFAVITEDEFRYETIVSKQPSRVKCPQHGTSTTKCTLMEAVHDGRRGVYCPTSQKFSSEADLDDEKAGILSEYKCPEHGSECGLRYCVDDGKKGGFCLVSEKFYPEEDLKGE